MALSVNNFFTHYVIHPQADELQEWEQNVALISSVVLGILTLGIAHLMVYLFSECCSSLSSRDIEILGPQNLGAEGAEDGSLASSNGPSRLLLLDGDQGTVACRIYGIQSATIPRLSDNWTWESATRSLLRMNNLIAVRGVPGASMVGPADYLGNLEDPDKYLYTIENGSPPVFYRTPITNEYGLNAVHPRPFDNDCVTAVGARWISGKDNLIKEKQVEYNVSAAQSEHSLFPDPGLLEIDRELVELPRFDPRRVDLSSFKARLVDSSVPFQITRQKLPSQDEYRLITYFYEAGYAQWQIEHGSGLFLERHDFCQTVTPLTADSAGFVTLGRETENRDQLELIAIQVPYGYTLIIEGGCIHGDTTLNGFFMMGMTSNHITMRTADTVFLKHAETKKNVRMVMTGQQDRENTIPSHKLSGAAMTPDVIYKGATRDEREAVKRSTEGKSFILNPSSGKYWQ